MFGWNECSSPYQLGRNVKREYREVLSMIYKITGGITLILALLVLGAWNFHTTVRTERTFNASVEDVWRVWNDADSIKKWWGPQGLYRTRRPERRARGWLLSLGDEI